MTLLTLGLLGGPGVFASAAPATEAWTGDLGTVEVDARTVPWTTVARLALLTGQFPPAYQPISEQELATVLVRARAAHCLDDDDLAELDAWLQRYEGGGGVRWSSCDCREPQLHLRTGGRVLAGYTELGDILSGEAGLGWSPGLNASIEPMLDLRVGRLWLSVTGRLRGRLLTGGRTFSDPGGEQHPLVWPGWPVATGRAQVRRARLGGGAWVIDAPQAVAGARLGSWSLSAGWAPRRTGPGMSGALALDRSGASFPAVTLRRVRPVRWSGFWRHVAPSHLLLRTGLLSPQNSRFRRPDGSYWEEERHPWFFQWLVGWQPVPWFRLTFSHTAMATAVDGTLWPDVLQINFPFKDVTWQEKADGPITDRIFSAQMELRWCNAPWPLLPAAAGRAWWDYAGTDFMPSGPGGLIPEITIPASVVGFELVSPVWDLAAEYAELEHYQALWYTNGGYQDGYVHEGWLLGHDLGGSGEALTGVVRVRVPRWPVEIEGQISHATWGMPIQTPGNGKRTALAVTLRRRPGVGVRHGEAEPLRWSVTGEILREKAGPVIWDDPSAVPSTRKKDWWRLYVKVAY